MGLCTVCMKICIHNISVELISGAKYLIVWDTTSFIIQAGRIARTYKVWQSAQHITNMLDIHQPVPLQYLLHTVMGSAVKFL